MKQKDLSRTSRRYALLFQLLFYFVPVSYGLAWFFAAKLPPEWLHQNRFAISGTITPLMSILGFLVSMFKASIVMLGIRTLQQLFKLYEKGVFFSEETVHCFKQLSRYLLLWVPVTVITEPLLSLVLTMNNPEGQRAVVLSFESADLTALIVGGVLSVIARIMESGRKLQEEVELTI